MYAKITHDSLWEQGDSIPSRVGTIWNTKDDAVGDILRFRTLDDDGIVYYSGEGDDEGLEVAFDFAYGDAGAVLLQIRDDLGNWSDYMC